MAEMLVQSENLTSIADKIRVLSGTEDGMSLSDMETRVGEANASIDDIITAIQDKGTDVPNGTKLDGLAALIGAIEVDGGGITPSGTLNITENGTYDVTEYASAEVNVGIGNICYIGTIEPSEGLGIDGDICIMQEA